MKSIIIFPNNNNVLSIDTTDEEDQYYQLSWPWYPGPALEPAALTQQPSRDGPSPSH